MTIKRLIKTVRSLTLTGNKVLDTVNIVMGSIGLVAAVLCLKAAFGYL